MKDGIREKVASDLRRLYDSVKEEPIPQEWSDLLRKLA